MIKKVYSLRKKPRYLVGEGFHALPFLLYGKMEKRASTEGRPTFRCMVTITAAVMFCYAGACYAPTEDREHDAKHKGERVDVGIDPYRE